MMRPTQRRYMSIQPVSQSDSKLMQFANGPDAFIVVQRCIVVPALQTLLLLINRIN